VRDCHALWARNDRMVNWLKKQKAFVFLESTKRDVPNRFSYIFVHPLDVIKCYRLDKIKDAFAQLQNYLNQGYYAAGFFSYETGYGFENLYQAKKNYRFPLIWLGIFKERIVLPSPPQSPPPYPSPASGEGVITESRISD